jgi:hypothetical protein
MGGKILGGGDDGQLVMLVPELGPEGFGDGFGNDVGDEGGVPVGGVILDVKVSGEMDADGSHGCSSWRVREKALGPKAALNRMRSSRITWEGGSGVWTTSEMKRSRIGGSSG